MGTRIKICGLTRREDAQLAADLGADALGFVCEKLSPRYIGDDPPKWVGEIAPFSAKVAVFGRVDRPCFQGMFDMVQGVEWEYLGDPPTKRILAVRLRPGQRADDLVNQTVNASLLLLDAFHEGAYGGTGRQVDWDLAAEIVQRAHAPVVLAGGLNPENVADAVRRVRPYAVDVSSGVEDGVPGAKDALKLARFFDAVRSAG